MDYAHAFAISAAGMTVERARVDVAALNLANANTVRGTDGRTYEPMRVVAEPGRPALEGPATTFGALVDAGLETSMAAGPQLRIVPSGQGPRQVYEPSHPMADGQGFVDYAGVDTATEMVSLMSATRAYEANVSAMNTSRTLALRALDIGSAG